MINKVFLRGEKVILLFLLFILGSCTHEIIEKEAPAINEIKAGGKFTIILPENHAEGSIWKLNDSHNKTVIDHINAAWHGNDKGIYYHFTALKPGTDTLRLTHHKLGDSIQTVTYIIKVTK